MKKNRSIGNEVIDKPVTFLNQTLFKAVSLKHLETSQREPPKTSVTKKCMYSRRQ